ncbi:lipopolysaccharide assembly protein LapB [Geobacter sp. DSM 9736]|uniref:tetratricopeptide repeat protein n=1 Tax=Geobacter sp. DSM 9736 TaxID=1277350 RepID=UPI000B50DCDB|nr:hypothetical protein [Geobacter sp. DSM 9736]SNB46184.1 Tetratricopeptide repeat-containing protein [Geobacter sp. DSM 9736]
MGNDTAALMAASKKYEDILARDPESYCFAPLSDVYRKLGLLDEALEVALKGCELHPDYIGGYMALGRACFEKGLYTESRQALRKVVEVMPENLLARRLLSELDEFSRGPDISGGAGEHPAEAALISPSGAEADDLEEIEELTEVVEDGEPSSGMAVEELNDEVVVPGIGGGPLATATVAELYAAQGLPELALQVYTELLAADPENHQMKRRAEELSAAMGRSSVDASPGGAMEERIEGGALLPEKGKEAQVLETLERWLAAIRRRR